MASAISTYKAFLMIKNNDSYEKLIDIKEFPDLGGAPERLQTTTLSDKAHTYIAGIQDTEDMTFTANYTLENFQAVNVYYDGEEHDFAVWLGGDDATTPPTPTGTDGKFKFKGMLSCYVNGGGVNEVVDMTITLTPSTVIELEADTTPSGGSD